MGLVVLQYHIDLCEQAGFVRLRTGVNPQIQLTWSGHEQVDASRSR